MNRCSGRSMFVFMVDVGVNYIFIYSVWGGTWGRRWLRHCAISRKVAGSISDQVGGIFHSLNPSGRTKTLGSSQPLKEMSTYDISWEVKAACA